MEKKYTLYMMRLLTATCGVSSTRKAISVPVTKETSTALVRKPSQGR